MNSCLMQPLVVLALVGSTALASDGSKTIVAFGDSTTASRQELRIYADRLQAEFPVEKGTVKVINAGIGGNTTEMARARFEKDVLAHEPDLVIIQFGINDAAVDVWKTPPATQSRVALSRYVENLRDLISTLRERQIDVILMTPNPLRWTEKMLGMYGKAPYLPGDAEGFNVQLKQYVAEVRKLASVEGVTLIDVDRSFQEYGQQPGQTVDDLLLDGIHPNEAGHRLVADLLLKAIATSPELLAERIRFEQNPVKSLISDTEQPAERIRFEDYVSNPPPGRSDPQEGWVAQFTVPFLGLIQPSQEMTKLTPLPPSVGLLVESRASTVGFYDPSSTMTCADLRGDHLILRFVDPQHPNKAAVVSRVTLRATGTSVLQGKLRVSLYDLQSKKIGSAIVQPDPHGQPFGEIDCELINPAAQPEMIHKVVLEHSGNGYFVVGGVTRPTEPDVAFGGFQVSNQTVQREPGEWIARPHYEQWEQHYKSELITDLTRCEPAAAISLKREHNKWKVFEYETAEYEGKCLSVGIESSAPDLTLKLNKTGWHAVYIGLSTITDLIRPAPNRVEVKFSSDPSYTRISNQLNLTAPRRDVLEEIYLGAANLAENDLDFSTVYQMPARIHYVKTIPLTDEEVQAIQADSRQRKTKKNVATFDGFTWIHPFRPQNRADLAATFAAYRDSDFGTWWFQVGGADLVHHPSKVGTLMGGHLDTFPRTVDREYTESVLHLHKQGIDPVRVAVEEAHAQGTEILICLRAAGWKGAPPWEEFFMSKFYEEHPEWRCIDIDGTPTMYLSYAVEEVQDHLIDVYREVLQSGADGAGFLFHRGMPMILWEDAFCKRFIDTYGVDPRTLPEDDSRVDDLRAEIVTSFIRKIRKALDAEADRRGEGARRLKFAVSTFATEADNRKFGLAVEQWIDEKLIDQIGIAWFAHYTSGLAKRKGDNPYYDRITSGTDVEFFPFYVGWKMKSASDFLQSVHQDYAAGADGIAVWDPNQFVTWESGKNPYWPLLSKSGHRLQVASGELLYAPVQTPLTRLGTNHYSRWTPNAGF